MESFENCGKIKAVIMEIARFSTIDGPGIRSTVFLKGCKLRCLWCHNPESHSFKPELMYDESKCLQCGSCAEVCRSGAQGYAKGVHRFERKNCVGCGCCVRRCRGGALELSGIVMTVDEVASEVLKDADFYRHSGGGVTLSGGEPLAAPEFSIHLLRKLKAYNIHCCIETSGFAETTIFQRVIEYTDYVIYDLKAATSSSYRALTGVGNELVLNNLAAIDCSGINYVVSLPLVPGLNDFEEELTGIAQIINRLKSPLGVVLHPYHPFGLEKLRRLGIRPQYNNLEFVEAERIAHYQLRLSQLLKFPVLPHM